MSTLKSLPTFVFIDASNIKNACEKSCNFTLSWRKLYSYFSTKYLSLKNIFYFEGIAKNDTKKEAKFDKLAKIGYAILSLTRKTYLKDERFREVVCGKCNNKIPVKTSTNGSTLKSNVDVYLAAKFMETTNSTEEPIHLILVSCDGDFVELIKVALRQKPNLCVSVFATPYSKNYNYLSSRFKELRPENRFFLNDISKIKDLIS